ICRAGLRPMDSTGARLYPQRTRHTARRCYADQRRVGAHARLGDRSSAMVSLNVNGKSYQADVDPRTPLLWVLREAIGLTGTKYGCGIAQCGACTVHLDGVATRS